MEQNTQKEPRSNAVDVLKDITLIAQIVQTGRDMRESQKQFFKDRTQKALQDSKRLEKEFDVTHRSIS